MSKNPLINALVAFGYIVIIASVMFYGIRYMPKQPDSFLAPVTMISLFTLSAAVMGYLFLYQPLMLYLDSKKKAAINLFLRTVAIFGAITILMLILLFSGVFSFK